VARHEKYELGPDAKRQFLTTGQAGLAPPLIERFWGKPLRFEAA
jgi:hypothetical protein